MPGVFISHSSEDKPFVNRLAVDLAIADIPVWLDTWELAPGDSLIGKIQEGIARTAFLIVVVSPASVKSQWVRVEMKSALAKEAQTKQLVVIPIQIGTSPLPTAVRGKIYADFQHAYRGPFERLVQFLKGHGAMDATLPANKRLIPLSFSNQVYLREAGFGTAVGRLLQASTLACAEQFLVAPDPVYDKLRNALLNRLDHMQSDPYYSYEFERFLESHYDRVRVLEEGLCAGIQQIVNQLPQPGLERESVTSACHHFAKLVRSELMGILYSCQSPDRLVVSERAPEWLVAPLEPESLQVLYKGRVLAAVDVGLPVRDDSDPQFPGFAAGLYDSFPVFIDTAHSEYRELYRWHEYLLASVGTKFERATISDLLVPQMLYRSLASTPISPVWDFDRLYYGRH